MTDMRHPPSKDLWRFCMERLRDLRGSDTRERDLANILGFEHSRAVRWKEGQMYVDRAEYLLRLADALEVDPMLLVGMAAGQVGVTEAHRQVEKAGKSTDEAARKSKAKAVVGPGEGGRATVALVATHNQGESDLREALAAHPDVNLIVASGLAAGALSVERMRPELVFLDLGLAGAATLESVRVLSSLITRGQRRCRVVVGTSTVTDEIEKSVLMAGAAGLHLFPFSRHVIDLELDRLEERLGPRKSAKR